MAREDFEKLARATARVRGLNEALVCAVIEQESDWNTWAVRYEPAFDRRYLLPMHLRPTQEICRAMSWGLMQVMGETALEHAGVNDPQTLLDPERGISAGTLVLKLDLAAADGDARAALLRWNGGSNPDYPAQVLARMAKYQAAPQEGAQ